MIARDLAEVFSSTAKFWSSFGQFLLKELPFNVMQFLFHSFSFVVTFKSRIEFKVIFHRHSLIISFVVFSKLQLAVKEDKH